MGPQLTPTTEQIETLRDLFFKKLEREGTPFFEDGLDQRDIKRVENSNRWLHLFLEQCDLDMKQSLKMLWDTCIWRKAYGANDLNEKNVNQEYLNAGIIFPRNKDIDGKSLLIFKSKLHQRGKNDVDELIRVLVYWIERLQRQDNLEQITILFDMYATGLSNLDMDFTKRFIDTFKLYYPNSLNYIIIFEMPWVLSAGFKVIKALLPPKGVARMRMVNAKTMKEVVNEDNMLSTWGGNDNYEFVFEPETDSIVEAQNIANHVASQQISSQTEPVFLSARKVHFANSSPSESPMSEISTSTFNDRNDAEMLRITPDEAIFFSKSGQELLGTVDILNISESNVTYKIKTTSPEKFRVRPSSGCLSPGANTTINVVLQQGQQPSTLSKDKFLVMCMALTAETATNPQSIADLWKNTPSNSPLVQQRRLKCSLPQQTISGDGLKKDHAFYNNGYGGGNDHDHNIDNTLAQLSNATIRLENQIKFSQNLQWITLCVFLLLSMAVVYILKQEINQSATGGCNPHHSEL